MNFTKFVSMLEAEALWLARADSFEDPFEGTWPHGTTTAIRNLMSNLGFAEQADRHLALYERVRRTVFANCWYISETESAAMWKLYVAGDEGVSVVTRVATLEEQLKRSEIDLMTSLVTYADYDLVSPAAENVLQPFVLKRASFSHECEYRILHWHAEFLGDDPWAVTDLNTHGPSHPLGIELRIEPAELIERVHVGPAAAPWFGDLVEKTCRRFGLGCEVERSTLYLRRLNR
jgi:hypothetical protein